jgi:nephrocystin-3
MDRLNLNLGIAYEDCQQYDKAFEYFRQWFSVCVDLYGLEHSKTRRPISTLNEPMYKNIALELGIEVPTMPGQPPNE